MAGSCFPNLIFLKTGILYNFCQKISMNIAAFKFVLALFGRAFDTLFLTSLYTLIPIDVIVLVSYRQNNFVVCDVSLQGLTKRSNRVIDHKIAQNTSFLKN